jgi:cation diffusion facilitator family transporter
MAVKRYLKWSIGAALATIALKTAAWWLTGSVGLLSDAMESGVNLAAAVFALWMVTVAHVPADDDHPFGHSKAEYFSSGFEGLLILAAAVGIFWTAAMRLLDPQPIEALGLGAALSLASAAINGGLAMAMLKAARQHESIALEADARHLFTDVWTSVGVVAGLLLVPLTGWLWLDPLLGMGVALNIVREAWSLLRRSIDGLMDQALSETARNDIHGVLTRLTDDTVHFDHVRTRRAANTKFCQLHMHVPGAWSLDQAAAQRESVERALRSAVDGLRVTIELLPHNALTVEEQGHRSPA